MKVTKCNLTGLTKRQEDHWISEHDSKSKSWMSMYLLGDDILVVEWHGYITCEENDKSEIIFRNILSQFNIRERGYHYILDSTDVSGTSLKIRTRYTTFLEKEIGYLKSHIIVGLRPVLNFITGIALQFNKNFRITRYSKNLQGAISIINKLNKDTTIYGDNGKYMSDARDNEIVEIKQENTKISKLEDESISSSKSIIDRSEDGIWRFKNTNSQYYIYGEIIDERIIYCKQSGDRTIADLKTFFHINEEMLKIQDNTNAILIEYIGNSKNVSENKRKSIVSFYYSLMGKISHLIFIKPSLFQRASILMTKYLLKFKYKVHIVKSKGEAFDLAYKIKRDENISEVVENEVGHTKNSSEIDIRISQLLNIVGRISWDPTFDLEYSKDIIGNDEFSILFESFDMLRDDIILMKKDLESHSKQLKTKVDKATDKLRKQNIELEKAKRQAERAKEEAEKANSLKSAFLANMSHEIRTPMNAIVGLTDILKDGNISEKDKKSYLNIISKSNIHLLNIINDVVDISKIESKEMKISSHKFCLNNLMRDLLESQKVVLKKSIKKDNLEYRLSLGLSDELSNIKTDSTRLRQVLLNLLNNAFKFTHKGEIDFGYTLKGDNLHFYVKDTGIGIEESKIDHIFERFTQAEGDTTRKYGGTGLGLSISKSLVELCGGTIKAESSLGKGSTFTFTLRYQYETDTITNELGDNSVFNFENLNILVAEDDDINFTVINAMLSPLGCNIERVVTGLEAVSEINKNENYDIIFMDIQMPEMDGIEATKLIREITDKIPIITLTANAFEDEMYKIKEAGATDYITKPFKKDNLVKSIKKSITRN